MKENEYMIFLLVYKTVANRGPQIIVESTLSYWVFSLPNICFEWNQNNTMFGTYFLIFHFSKKGSVYGSESEKSRLLKQTAEWPCCRWISRNYSQFSPKPFGGLRTYIAVWWWVSFQMSCTYWMNYTLCRSHTCSVFFDSKQSKFHTPTRNKLISRRDSYKIVKEWFVNREKLGSSVEESSVNFIFKSLRTIYTGLCLSSSFAMSVSFMNLQDRFRCCVSPSVEPAPGRAGPNWITGPGLKSGSVGKSESRGPENGVSRWRRPNSDIYSQNYYFGLVYGMIYQFLGIGEKNYKFGMFCQQCHPSMASVDADIQPRNASWIHNCHLFSS